MVGEYGPGKCNKEWQLELILAISEKPIIMTQQPFMYGPYSGEMELTANCLKHYIKQFPWKKIVC